MNSLITVFRIAFALLLTFNFSLSTISAQNDTMYVMKDGAVVGQYNVNTEVDSVIFYKPTVALNDTAGTFTDSRDGNEYNWVKIGDQVWMAENLRATHYADGTPIPKVTGDTEWDNLGPSDTAYCWYNNDSASNAETYGALYTWAAAMNGAASSNSNPSGVQGVCPDGWHLPSDDEWEELAEFISNDNGGYTKDGDHWNNVGGHLKATSGWVTGNNGTDDYGFSGLPGGFRRSDGAFYYIGSDGYWWSATEYATNYVWLRYLFCDYEYFLRYDYLKEDGFSVRCLRD
jgi:uncharacterized protein (TIGR02145 family)